MSKAFDIKNKAQDELLAFAVFELNNIIEHCIAIGACDREDEEPYEVDTTDSLRVAVDVQDTYSLDIYSERRKVESFIKYPDEDVVYLRVEDEEEPIALRALPFDSIVELVDELETMWNNLVKTK